MPIKRPRWHWAGTGRGRHAERGGEGAVFSGGVGCWRLRLRRTDCCYLPYSWPCLGWTGGVGEGAPRRRVRPPSQSRRPPGRLLPAAPAHPGLPGRSPGASAAGPALRWARSGRRRGPLGPQPLRGPLPFAPQAGLVASRAPLGGGVPGRLGPSAGPHRAGGEPARKPGGRQRARPSRSGCRAPPGLGTSDLGGRQSCAPRAPGVCSRPGGSCSARVPGLPLPGGSAGLSTKPSPAGVRPYK